MTRTLPGHHVPLSVLPIDIATVECPVCGSIDITTEFRIALRTRNGGGTWAIASDFQPLDEAEGPEAGKSICEACEHTASTDDFRTDKVA